MTKLFVAIFSLCMVLSNAYAKDLYVNNTGSPECSDATTYANNGNATPWCSFGRAVWGSTDRDSPNTSEAAQAGDTVYVAEGTYNYNSIHDAGGYTGPALYCPVNTGTEGNWIVFQGQGAGATLTTTTTGCISGNGGAIIGTTSEGVWTTPKYIEWDNFIISANSAYQRFGSGLVNITMSVDYIKVENCTITGNSCDMSSNNHPGILVHGVRSGNGCSSGITGVEIIGNTISGFDFGSSNDAGIIMYCVEEFSAENNEFYDNTLGMYFKNAYNPVGKLQSYIKKNIFRDNGKGLEFQAWNNIEITQNIFKDNTVSDIKLIPATYYSGESGQQDIEIVNNTFDNSVAVLQLAWLCDQFEDNFFQNNIITNHTRIIRSQDTACESTANMGTDDFLFNYSAYEYSGNFFYSDGGYEVATLAEFISDFGQSANQWNDVDCLYIDEENDNFRLQAGSTCREGQANDGVDILDLDNDSSTTDAITIGAYITGNEVIGPGPTYTPTISGLRISAAELNFKEIRK